QRSFGAPQLSSCHQPGTEQHVHVHTLTVYPSTAVFLVRPEPVKQICIVSLSRFSVFRSASHCWQHAVLHGKRLVLNQKPEIITCLRAKNGNRRHPYLAKT